MTQNITENLDDPDFCKGVVLSLRTYLSVTKWPDAPIEHMSRIAYGEDGATKALIELQKMEE